jgi:uncharacterized protein YggE
MKTLILFFSAYIILFPAMAQEIDAKTPLIEVEGFSERKLTPDEAVFSIRLEEKSMKVNEAVNRLNTKTSKLAESLKKFNIQDYKLIADNYSVTINQIYRSGYEKDSGYIASQNLLIVTKSTNQDLQKIVETIQNSGDMSFNLNFKVSENTLKSLEDTLLVEALKNAESRAQLIAQTLVIKNIRVNKVTLTADPIPFQNNMIMMRAATQDSEMLISPDQQIIQKRVYVHYTY